MIAYMKEEYKCLKCQVSEKKLFEKVEKWSMLGELHDLYRSPGTEV
jgi:hypothetical protein